MRTKRVKGKGVTVTTKLKLNKLTPEIKKEFTKRTNQRTFVDMIVQQILSGVSPVAKKSGAPFGRFKSYADSYEKIKGRAAPVDMLNDGQMLESLRSRKVSNQDAIKFTFYDEVAYFHDRKGIKRYKRGTSERDKRLKKAKKEKIFRRLLPSRRGERFIKKLMNGFIRVAKKSARKAVKKQNR